MTQAGGMKMGIWKVETKGIKTSENKETKGAKGPG